MSSASTNPGLRCLVVNGQLHELEIADISTDNQQRTPSVVRFVPVLNVSEDADGDRTIEPDVRREFMGDRATFDKACDMTGSSACLFVVPDHVLDEDQSMEEALQMVHDHCRNQLITFAASARSLGFTCVVHDSADPSSQSRFSTDVYHLAVRDFASGELADYALLNSHTIEFHDASMDPSQMAASEPALRVDLLLRLYYEGTCEGTAVCGEAEGSLRPMRALYASHRPHWKDCESSRGLGGSLGDLHQLAGVLTDWTRLHRASEFAEQHGLAIIHC